MNAEPRRYSRRWSRTEEALAKKYYLAGWPLEQIAELLHRSVKGVRIVVKSRGKSIANRAWTNSEMKFLRLVFFYHDISTLAAKLNRRNSEIESKARELGLYEDYASYAPPDSEAEEQELERLDRETKELEKALRQEAKERAKAAREIEELAKAKKPRAKPSPAADYPPWSPDEITFLKKYCKKMIRKTLARKLGKTVEDIAAKAKELAL